ncbi:unnamed protein product, partial [Ranitomeya imitator]
MASYAKIYFNLRILIRCLVTGELSHRPLSSDQRCRMRFIDDVLFIWQGSQEDLDKFLEYLSVNTWNIKITTKFLLDSNGSLHTNIFRKETSVNTFLHATSRHPAHVVSAIPTRQFIRARRICDQDWVFEEQTRNLTKDISWTIYNKPTIWPRKLIDKLYLLHSLKRNQADKFDSLRITPLDKGKLHIYVLSKYWPILKQDHAIQQFLLDRPLITAKLNTGRSLLSLCTQNIFLVGSQSPKWGTWCCANCKGCKYIVKTNVFIDSSGEKEYKILHYINCRTSCVIYLATYLCEYIYVGMTTRELRVHILEHIKAPKDIRAASKISQGEMDMIKKLKPLARHFCECHPQQEYLLHFRGINRIYSGNRRGNMAQRLAQVECKWITVLKRMTPRGLNEQWERGSSGMLLQQKYWSFRLETRESKIFSTTYFNSPSTNTGAGGSTDGTTGATYLRNNDLWNTLWMAKEAGRVKRNDTGLRTSEILYGPMKRGLNLGEETFIGTKRDDNQTKSPT